MNPLAERVRRQDPDRFLASLFAAADRRDSFWVLCAFNHELARAREVVSEPMLALIRLQWWRDTVLGERRRHDVAEPLGVAIDTGQLLPADLLAMIDGREVEADETIPDLSSWHAYLNATAGAFAVAAGRLLGADQAGFDRLRTLGAAYGAVGQIESVGVLAAQRRCQLPLDLLAAHGLLPEDIMRQPSKVAPVLAELRSQGLRLLQSAAGPIDRRTLPAVLPAVLARRDLRRGMRSRGLGDTLAVIRAALVARI